MCLHYKEILLKRYVPQVNALFMNCLTSEYRHTDGHVYIVSFVSTLIYFPGSVSALWNHGI